MFGQGGVLLNKTARPSLRAFVPSSAVSRALNAFGLFARRADAAEHPSVRHFLRACPTLALPDDCGSPSSGGLRRPFNLVRGLLASRLCGKLTQSSAPLLGASRRLPWCFASAAATVPLQMKARSRRTETTPAGTPTFEVSGFPLAVDPATWRTTVLPSSN